MTTLSPSARAELRELLVDIQSGPFYEPTGRARSISGRYAIFSKIEDALPQLLDQLDATEQQRDEALAALAEPTAVYVNMLRGIIARPSPRNIWHLYGYQALIDAMPESARALLSKVKP